MLFLVCDAPTETVDFGGLVCVRVAVPERVPDRERVALRVCVCVDVPVRDAERDSVAVWLGEVTGVIRGVGARMRALTGATTTPRKMLHAGADATTVAVPVAVTYDHSVVVDTAYTTKDACAAS